MKMNTAENMNNTAGNVSRSLTSLISKIKTDQSDLSKTLPSNTSYDVLHNSEAAVYYGQFYTLYLIITILVFILIIMIYLHFFSWVLKVLNIYFLINSLENEGTEILPQILILQICCLIKRNSQFEISKVSNKKSEFVVKLSSFVEQ